MQDKPDEISVAIITTTYKRVSSGELDRVIQSVDDQSFKNWKHYIIGDNCPELAKYKHKLEKFDSGCRKGKRIIINLEERSNNYGATLINHCLELSNEKYFCILADDNYWLPFHLSYLMEFLQRNDDIYDAVWGNTILKHKKIPEYFNIRCETIPRWNCIDLNEPIYKKELWDKFGPYKYEDRLDIGDIRFDGSKYSYDWHFIHDCVKGKAQFVHLNADPSIVWYLDEKYGLSKAKWEKIHTVLRIGANPAGDGGCAWYRLKYPLNKLTEKNKAYTIYYDPKWNSHKAETFYQNQEVVVFQGVASFEVVKLIQRLKEAGKVCVVDVDDNITAIDYDNSRYVDMGTKDIMFQFNDKQACLNQMEIWRAGLLNENMQTTHIDEQMEKVKASGEEITKFNLPIFKHGFNGFNVERNLKTLTAWAACLKEADGVQTTTQHFADFLKRYNNNVKVFPNSIDFKLWDGDLRYAREDGKIRIIYQGGSSHFEDLMLIRDSIADILKRHPECIFVCMGFYPEAVTRILPKEQVEVYPWCDFREYPYRFHRLRGDIGIIPLRTSGFADCKSPIKWVEMSALRIPCIASNSIVYNKDIVPGKTGFLFDTADEFSLHLEALIKSKELRTKIGDQAHEYVKKNYDLNIWADKQLRWYECMWLGKNVKQPEKNTLTPILKKRLEEENGVPLNNPKHVARLLC